MAAFNLDEIFKNFSLSIVKSWSGHNRIDTVGGSELGQCHRKTAFVKHEFEPDPDYDESRGALDRGSFMENHYWEPAIKMYAEAAGIDFQLSGIDQKTLVDGYISATPDGLLIGVDRDCLSYLGIDDIGGNELVVECKTIDPRSSLVAAKPEHVFQVQIQMGLIHAATNYRPLYALITYIDASFWDRVQSYAVQFLPEVFNAAKTRALKIMTAKHPTDLSAEGTQTGGCEYCAYKKQCKEFQNQEVPKWKKTIEDRSDVETLKDLVKGFAAAKDAEAEAKTSKGRIRVEIEQILEAHDTRSVDQDGLKISWSAVKGKQELDREALGKFLEDNGTQISQFNREGSGHKRLTAKLKP